MPEITYTTKKLSPGSLSVVDQANKIISEYAAQGFDLTLRQLLKFETFQFLYVSLVQFRSKEPPPGFGHTEPPVIPSSFSEEPLRHRLIAPRPASKGQRHRHGLKSENRFQSFGTKMWQQQFKDHLCLSGRGHPAHRRVGMFFRDRVGLDRAGTDDLHKAQQGLLVTHCYLHEQAKGVRTQILACTCSLPVDVNAPFTIKQAGSPGYFGVLHN